jgi:RimJ/RimL family protein N-acetyltransferase
MPPTSLSFTSTTDPAEAKTWFGELIEREPVSLSVIGSVTDALIADPTRFENPRWWAGREHDAVVAAYMHTPPHALHIGLSTVEQARGLAAHLAAAAYQPPAVGGVREAAEGFADAWTRLTGIHATTVMELGAFDLPARPRMPFEVRGRHRLAGADDLDLVDGWAHDFHVEALPEGPAQVASLAPHVTDGRVALWVVDDEPVSMAYASLANGGVTRISGVWTSPTLRGNGYASAVVAALSNDRMDHGERCMLYTDLANPTSNAIYQALGYRRIGDSVTIRFT